MVPRDSGSKIWAFSFPCLFLSLFGTLSLCDAYKPLIAYAFLPDGREDALALNQTFFFPQSTVRYVQFQVKDYWGAGGGLQAFEVLEG